VNIIVWIIVSGFFSAFVGIIFGIPSLRIKGFYLAVATLAAQFFLQWCFVRIPWLYNYNASGAIEVGTRTLFGIPIVGPNATPEVRYYVLLCIVVALTWIASNIVHGRIGRSWMAVRDMDIAAELMGIKLLDTKLLAFAVSSFYAGVAGACMMFLWYGGGEASDAFNINQSFNIRCRIHFHAADGLEVRASGDWYSLIRCHGRTSHPHYGGWVDHFLPDRRTARPRAALADRETEIADVALPILRGWIGHRRDTPPS
jgi:hypothetical protein